MGNFSNIIGYKSVVSELEVLLDIINNKSKYEKLNASIVKNLLLNGEPGCGKTTLAIDFMNATNRKQYVIRKTKADGSFIDEITKTVEDAIKNAPSIILLDDLDKFSEDDDFDSDSEEFVVVQAMMDKAKDEDVFFIGTVNKIQKLPRSLTRSQRFDRVIAIGAPSKEDAELIIAHYLKDKPNVGDVDTKLLARLMLGKTNADLETICNEAAIKTAYDNRDKISMDDMVQTILTRVFHSLKSDKPKTEYYSKLASIHESGHAICNEYLEPGYVDLVSIANYESSIGGITSVTQNDDYFADVTYMENRVITLLAGKAATEVILGIKDTGANSDIHRAYDITERFVDNYCNFGFEAFELQSSGNDLRNKKTHDINFLMELYYQKAKQIVYKNKDAILKLADRLVQKDYVLPAEIKEIMDSCKKVA